MDLRNAQIGKEYIISAIETDRHTDIGNSIIIVE